MTKYRLSDEPRSFSYQDNGHKKNVLLHQIIALTDFNDVQAGTPGGWIDDDSVLAQNGDCWIYDENAIAFAGAVISGNARITGASVIREGAQVGDNAWIDQQKSAMAQNYVTTSRSKIRRFVGNASFPVRLAC